MIPLLILITIHVRLYVTLLQSDQKNSEIIPCIYSMQIDRRYVASVSINVC